MLNLLVQNVVGKSDASICWAHTLQPIAVILMTMIVCSCVGCVHRLVGRFIFRRHVSSEILKEIRFCYFF